MRTVIYHLILLIALPFIIPDCNKSRIEIRARDFGAIESHTMSQTAPAGVHRRIAIENNIYLGSDGNIIKLGSADSVKITDNMMDHPRNAQEVLAICELLITTGEQKYKDRLIGL